MIFKDRLDRPISQSKTVDPREIERFTALAEEWWNPDGKFRPLHKFNPVRSACISQWVACAFNRSLEESAPFGELRILDVGCGAGLLCEPLAERGAEVTGIDATARNIEIARWHAAQNKLNVDYRHCLAEELVDSGLSFDVVLNTEVIEHVADAAQLMKACCELTRPGGIMIVATINRTLRSFALAIVGAEYVLRWLPKGTHDWRRFVTPGEIRSLIEPHGLRISETTGVTYNPLGDRWKLSANTSVNYMMLATKPKTIA